MKIKYYLKHMLYFLLFYSGLLHVLILFFKKIKKKHSVLILFYHRFHSGNYTDNLLPSLDIEKFRKQIFHLKKFYTFISMDEVALKLKNGRNIEQPAIALTIDDGYLSNYTLAYSILSQYHIPCLIYLTVGPIGTQSGLWVDDIEYALMNSTVETFCYQELFGDNTVDISTLDEKEKVLKRLFLKMLKLESLNRRKLVDTF